MRLRHMVAKRSLGRLAIHHLRSPYHVEINEATLLALEAVLRDDALADPRAQAWVERLERRGLVVTGTYEPIPMRGGSDLVGLELEPISRCNLSCGHCFVSFSRARMSEEVFEAVLAGAGVLGAVEFTFNGGEPLLHPRCVDWIASAVHSGHRAVLFTNATLATQRVVTRLADAGLAKAVVSLDGLQAQHDALRGPGAFERSAKALRRLRDAGICTVVTSMVTPGNEQHRGALQRYCVEQLGVESVRWSTVAPMGRAAGRPEFQLTQQSLRSLYAEREAPHGFAAPPRPLGRPAGLLPCAAGVDKLFVAADGGVHACHLFEQAAAPLGSLRDASLAEIYASVSRSGRGDPYRGFDVAELPACATCPALARCLGGCRARAWRMTGSRLLPDPVSCAKWGIAPSGAEWAHLRGEAPA